MATITGTLRDCVALERSSTLGRQAFLLSYDFASYAGAADDILCAAVGAGIAAKTRSGKTYTLLSGCGYSPGQDTTGALFYPGVSGIMTLAGVTLTGNLENASTGGAEVAATGVVSGVKIIVIVTES